MNSQTVFVGPAPNRTGNPLRPLSGSLGTKLRLLSGLGTDEYRRVPKVNLLQRWPGSGSRLNKRAVHRAAALQHSFKRFVLLGRDVAKAFGLEWLPLQMQEREGRQYFMLPH